MGKSIAKLLIVLLLIAAVVFAAFGSYTIFGVTQKGAFEGDISIKQGLDLVGGSVITFEAEAESATAEQMATVVSVMRKRLDSANYTEAVVSTQGEKRVRIEIPAVSNPDDAIALLGKTAQLQFVDADGNAKYYKVSTDKKTVGEALLDANLISGENGAYGLYVKTVAGMTYDYDKDGKYWAFYVNGEMSPTGVDMTDITEGAAYAFRAE